MTDNPKLFEFSLGDENLPNVYTEITLRDLFAAFAMCGLMHNLERTALLTNEFAAGAYIMADAMLRAREKTP